MNSRITIRARESGGYTVVVRKRESDPRTNFWTGFYWMDGGGRYRRDLESRSFNALTFTTARFKAWRIDAKLDWTRRRFEKRQAKLKRN